MVIVDKKDNEPLKVTIEWKVLERIADYYGFPSVMFLTTEDFWSAMPRKTRDESTKEIIDAFTKIQDIINEFQEKKNNAE